MINVHNKTCIYENCKKQSNFNYNGNISSIYCATHKLNGMINVKKKNCSHENCNKHPIFNNPGNSSGMYCTLHKLEGMINVKTRRCVYENCTKQPSWNHPGTTTGVYCATHKLDEMINVKVHMCAQINCTKQASFNYPKEVRKMYCAEHKKKGMINIKHKRCIYEGCTNRSSFNVPHIKNGAYCNKHKLPGMIGIFNKKCQVNKCKHDALYGLSEHHRAQFCEEHRDDGHIHVFKERQCSMCDMDYAFVLQDTNEKYCVQHCPNEGYMNAMKRLCKYCDIRESSRFVCVDCVQRSHKKEWAVVAHLRKHVNMSFKYDDYQLNPDCTKKRPDIHFDLATHSVIVEVDENEHRTYSDLCECARLNEIVNSIGGKPVVFIRYNPDSVRHKGKTIEVNPADRIDKLVNVVKRELTEVPNVFCIKLVQLWYSDDLQEYMPEKTEDLTLLLAV